MDILERLNPLIDIGKNPSDTALLESAKQYDLLDRNDSFLGKTLLVDDLAFLIKGLTLVEKKQGGRGSASSIIWLYRILDKRSPVLAEETATWVLQNKGRNSYIPYGSSYTYGAQTHEEYIKRKALHQKQSKDKLGEIAKDREIVRIEKRTLIEQKKRAHNDRNTETRTRIINHLQTMSLTKRLERIACDDLYSINFYPTRWANETDIEDLEALSSSIRGDLLQKLRGRQRGPWGNFKRKLTRFHSG